MDSGQPIDISVVMPTYRRRDVVVASVRALAGQQGALPFEVVVVVDGASDGSAEALRALEVPFPLRVLEVPHGGRAAACNAGADAAGGRILLFLDDDMEADPRLLAEHMRALETGADVVLGHVPLHPLSATGFLAAGVGAWAEARAKRIESDGGRLGLHDLVTGQMSIHRSLFTALGGFDASFNRGGAFGNEDLDLGHRLLEAGARIVFARSAITRQRYVVSPRRYLRQWRQAGRADVALARKHPELVGQVFKPLSRLSAADRRIWRPLRVPLRESVLALAALKLLRGPLVPWFYRARNLEYLRGVGAAGGVPGRRPVRVLCYHAIADLRDAPVLAEYGIPAARFRRQLALLCRHFHLIDGEEFARFLEGAGVPRRAVLLTFDDCYADLVTAALPVLKNYGASAVAFAVTDRIGGVNDWDAAIGAPALPLVDAGGLEELERAGIAIGSHTRRHRPLDRLPGDELADELAASLAEHELLFASSPRFLAYPHGAYDEEVKRIAAAVGFSAAFTVDPGFVEADADPYAIPRLEILASDSGWRFVRKLIVGAPNRFLPPRR